MSEARITPIAARQENSAMRVPVQTECARRHCRLEYRLNCGRNVQVEEFYVSLSMLGFLAGRKEAIRAEVIKQLPERARAQFPGNYGFLIKPAPEGRLPAYTFMVALTCDQPVCDPTADFSNLVVCWLSDDIETPLPELISREICAVDWERYAVDSWT